MAINNDENASIFNVAHYAIIGDIYEIIPKLIDKLRNDKLNINDLVTVKTRP